ncbi:MAG TPA: GAF domain-containing protein, partial [Nannocystis exedens]|nr:GAF domain-containing protein [Nannocystis exedens]
MRNKRVTRASKKKLMRATLGPVQSDREGDVRGAAGDGGSEVEVLRRRCAELEAKARHLEIIKFFAASLLYTETDLDEILWEVANKTVARLGIEDCVIYLLEGRGDELVWRAAFGPKNSPDCRSEKPPTIRVGEGIVGQVAATGKPLRIADKRLEPGYLATEEKRLSKLVLPIFFNDEVIGVIDSEHSAVGFFTDPRVE